MSPARARVLAQRYVDWVVRRRLLIFAATTAIFATAVYLIAFHLPLKADLANLLPPDAPSVRDLKRLEERVSAQDTALMLVKAPDAATRAAATADLAARLRALPPTLVNRVETDDAVSRAYLRAHRHLFVPLADLERARTALTERIKAAKLEANPLYIDVDEDDSKAAADKAKADLDDLDKRRKDALAALDKSSFVSADGTISLLIVRTAFSKTDADEGRKLVASLRELGDAVTAAHPGVEVGMCGGVVSAVAEHDALIHGMLWSSLVTAFLVGLVLVLYFRSIMLLVLLGVTLIAGTTVAFGAAAIAVGHLNAATAFLGAIIAGNGVNYGILLIGRYLEERRRHDDRTAMAAAIDGTLRPTLVASLGASIAYGSLAATSFRGFADFAIIGAIGMLLCWVATLVVLPPMVLALHRAPRSDRPSRLGTALATLLGFRRPAVVALATAALAIGAGVVAYGYISSDPFEYDIKKLRSDGAEARVADGWLQLSDKTFGRGIAGQTYVAADSIEQVPLIVAALRKVDEGVAEEHRTIGTIRSYLDVVPPDQDQKLAILADIRALLDDPALEELTADERARIDELRPPDGLTATTLATLPEEIAVKLRERDGRVGNLIGVRPDRHLNEWNGHDLIRFATAVRTIQLSDGETITTSGPDMIFADIVGAIRADGGIVTLIASIGLILMVLLIVGRNLRAFAVLTATALGSLGLVAVCDLAGIKVNFLDFVALPITLGLGVDYAINMAHRHDHGEDRSARATLMSSGSAVFVCSLTTIIGYGSLLVSDNLAIRGFGVASLIGEVMCLSTALIVVPAILSLGHRRQDRRRATTGGDADDAPDVDGAATAVARRAAR
ncbi:MAG: MMPL family transporter [Deltaproteobacteria bacterium]|nr:MMPL family transporter [Deltaproteobacteria bacterium]